jgi:HK97 family phage portal protein
MGKRHKISGQRKAVQLQMAGSTGASSGGDVQTISASEAFEGQWGPSYRGGGRLPSVQPPTRFRTDADAVGAYELIPLIFACVSTIAENGAMLPIVVRRGGEVLPATRPSKIRDLLTRPNPMMTRFELLEAIFTYVELCGDAYLLKDEQDGYGRPRTLWPLYAALMEPEIDQHNGLTHYSYHLHTGIRFELDDIVHFKRFRPDDFYRGLGTVQAGARAGEEADNTAAYAASFFKNGAKIAGVLQSDQQTIAEPTRNRVLQDWRDMAGGVENAHRVVVLSSGLRYQAIAANPGDLALHDLRRFTREELLMLFRMPPTKVGLYEHANYKSEQADRDFWNECMKPRVLRVQAKLQEIADLFGEGDEVILELPQFRDRKVMAEIAEIMGRTGRATDNEIREVLDLPPDKNGDRYRLPLNLVAEDYTVMPRGSTPKTGGKSTKAVSALHQEALTASLQREKANTEQFAAAMNTSGWHRFFNEQEARVVAAIEAASKAAGGTRKMYASLYVESDGKALGLGSIFNRRTENSALYAVGRITHAFAGERAAGWLKAAAGIEATWAPEDPLTVQVLDALNKRPEFRGINDTTRDAIAAVVALAEQRKYNAQQLIAGVPSEGFGGIKGVFDEARGSRTQTIIRNEIGQAWNRAMLDLGTAYGVQKWVITDGDHDGPGSVGPDGLSCAERNGLVVDGSDASNHCAGSHPNCVVAAAPYFGDVDIGGRI